MLIASSAHAQLGTGSLKGVVTNADSGSVVADAAVTPSSPDLQIEQVVVTDRTGHFWIPDLPPGTYRVLDPKLVRASDLDSNPRAFDDTDKNRAFGAPTRYQAPFTLRLAIRSTFQNAAADGGVILQQLRAHHRSH